MPCFAASFSQHPSSADHQPRAIRRPRPCRQGSANSQVSLVPLIEFVRIFRFEENAADAGDALHTFLSLFRGPPWNSPHNQEAVTPAPSFEPHDNGLSIVFVMATNPVRSTTSFISTLGHQVKVVVVDVQHVVAPVVARMAVKHGAVPVLIKHAVPSRSGAFGSCVV